jgi:alkylmercury lyase
MEKKMDLTIDQFEHMLNELDLNGSEKVYAHLLKGESLPVKLFAELLGIDADEAEKVLASYGEVDDQGQVIGFLGLSLMPTPHKLMVKGKTLYTWCAADTFLLPQFLSFSALVESKDPVSNQLIQLSIDEDFLDWTDPVPIYISWIEKADSCHMRQSFCNRSHFFASEETAAKWLTENADAKISNVEEFFTFSRGGRGCC